MMGLGLVSPFPLQLHEIMATTIIEMDADPRIRLRCPFCFDLLPVREMTEHRKAVNGCPAPLYSDDRGLYCFTCNASDEEMFSTAQKSRAEKGSPARCIHCVEKGLKRRYQLPIEYPTAAWASGQQLMDFVSAINVEGVRELLQRNADIISIANHKRQLFLGLSLGYAWDDQGLPWPETDEYQAFSPLRMVAFRISDCCLSLEDLKSFQLIAQLLIDAGADVVDAAVYLRNWYGSSVGTGDDLDDSENSQLQEDHEQDDSNAKQKAFLAVCRMLESAAGVS